METLQGTVSIPGRRDGLCLFCFVGISFIDITITIDGNLG